VGGATGRAARPGVNVAVTVLGPVAATSMSIARFTTL
jgi:hypothetical protein